MITRWQNALDHEIPVGIHGNFFTEGIHLALGVHITPIDSDGTTVDGNIAQRSPIFAEVRSSCRWWRDSFFLRHTCFTKRFGQQRQRQGFVVEASAVVDAQRIG